MHKLKSVHSTFALLVGLCLVGLLGYAATARALPPKKILQAPVYIQNGSTILCYFAEDGGTTCLISAYDPANLGNTYVSGSLGVDGGTTAHNLQVTNITDKGIMTADGGAYVANAMNVAGGLAVTGGALSDTTTVTSLAAVDGGAVVHNGLTVTGGTNIDANYVSGLSGVDGGITELGGNTVMALTHKFAATDNTLQCYIGAIGTAITFSPAFGSGTPHCSSCVDVTDSTKACGATATTTTGTLTGTGTDAVNICFQGIK